MPALSHSNDPGSSVTSKLSKVGTPRYAGKVKKETEAGVNKWPTLSLYYKRP